MKPQVRPCPMCGERLDTAMQLEVCGTCYQELRSSGAIALHSTSEFAAIRPARVEKSLEALQAAHARLTGETDDDMACTWCGKTRKQVKKLLASGHVRICNECVGLCAAVLEAELGSDWR